MLLLSTRKVLEDLQTRHYEAKQQYDVAAAKLASGRVHLETEVGSLVKEVEGGETTCHVLQAKAAVLQV